MSGQYWDIIHQVTDSSMVGAAATSKRFAFYVPAANIAGVNSLARFGFMIQATPSGAALPLGTVGHSINRYQVIVDGKPMLDYINPLATTDPDGADGNDFDYYIQKAGGTVTQLPRAQAAELTYVQYLPLGIPLTNREQRIEVAVDFDIWDNAAGYWNAGVTTSAMTFSVIAMYGTSAETLQIGSGQTYLHSANATESVVIRGDASKGAMAGVLVFNDTQTDELSAAGIKAQLGGNYQLPLELHEVLNNDAVGIGGLSIPALGDVTRVKGGTSLAGLLGASFINTFNLTAGANLTLQVSSSAQTTRYYYPIYVKPLGQPNQAIPKMAVTTKPMATKVIADDKGQS